MNGEFLMLLVSKAFWAAVAALGFAILFNVPKRDLPFAVLLSAAGYGVRTLLVELGVVLEGATLVGALVIGFTGYFWARYRHKPAILFTVPAVIPMIPGSFAFRTMLGVIELADLSTFAGTPVLVETAVNATKTGLILIALATGITAPNLLFMRRKPVV